MKFVELASSLEILAGVNATVVNPKAIWRHNSSLLRGLQVFNGLDEVQPHYGGQSASIQSLPVSILMIPFQTYLHSNV